MNRKRVLISVLAVVVLIGAALGLFFIFRPQPAQPNQEPSDEALAEKALTDYLTYLSEGKYQGAVDLYDGSYELLQGYNPDVDPSDHATLLEQACTHNGFRCLQPQEITYIETNSEGEFVFSVKFLDESGELLVIGPCCGGNATDSPPRSEFSLRVQKSGPGQFKTLDLPPYTP
jgi:hypothetical protein